MSVSMDITWDILWERLRVVICASLAIIVQLISGFPARMAITVKGGGKHHHIAIHGQPVLRAPTSRLSPPQRGIESAQRGAPAVQVCIP